MSSMVISRAAIRSLRDEVQDGIIFGDNVGDHKSSTGNISDSSGVASGADAGATVTTSTYQGSSEPNPIKPAGLIHCHFFDSDGFDWLPLLPRATLLPSIGS